MTINQINALIVEDELLVPLLEEKILVHLGYKVMAKVTDAERAVRMAKKASPDIILMDIYLRGQMTGIEAAKRIWMFSDVPIVFVSDSHDICVNAYPSLSKNHAFVCKPFSKSSLSLTLHKLLLCEHPSEFSAKMINT